MNTIVIDYFKNVGKRLYLLTVFCLAIPTLLIWCTLVLKFTLNSTFGNILGFSFPTISIVLILVMKDITKSIKIFGSACALIAIYYFSITPSLDRNWEEDVAKLPEIAFKGRMVTIKNFRNFTYRSNHDFDKTYETRTYDLDLLEGCDFILSYWDGHRSIGHTFISFRFKDQPPIAISVEVRKEKGESYHPVNGLFKQFELIYVIGDEKDLIPLRTHYRHEETFLYPLTIDKKQSEVFLVSLLKGAQELQKNPLFYHSLDQNCTTTLVRHINSVPNFKVELNSDLLLNGLSDYAVYKMGGINQELEFSVLKRCCYISKTAKKLTLNDKFSVNLRLAVRQKIQEELNQSP